jgi:chemotaxis protein CheC
MVFSPLNEQQFDALREISNVGMGHAATALSQLTGKTIYLNVPRALLLDTAGMVEYLGGTERQVVGIYLRMLGNAQGQILMVFPWENAIRILRKLLPPRASIDDALTELEHSALMEVGNILASAYLNALGGMLNMTLLPSVPVMSIGMAGTVIDHVRTEFGEASGKTLLLDTEFCSADECIKSQFFLLPAPSSLDIILAALGINKS